MLDKNCVICNKPFKVYQCREKTAKYCSFTCRNKDYKGKHFSVSTEFKKNQKFSEKRNKKISQTHQKNHRLRKEYIKLNCKECKKIFFVKPYLKNTRKFCSNKCCTSNIDFRTNASNRMMGYVHSKTRNKKISLSLKGKLPKNWKDITTNINVQFWQKKLYNIINKYFDNIIWEHKVQISKNKRRFLDVALIDLKIDFEYDGKIHLKKSVQIKDAQREKELKYLGWKIYRFNKDNFNECDGIIQQIYAEENLF